MKEEKEKRQDLKRTTKKVKSLLHSKIRELDNRESQLFLKFLATQPEAVLKFDAVELVWTFIMFLKTSGYHILHGNTIFCMPLTRMVKMKDLKGHPNPWSGFYTVIFNKIGVLLNEIYVDICSKSEAHQLIKDWIQKHRPGVGFLRHYLPAFPYGFSRTGPLLLLKGRVGKDSFKRSKAPLIEREG